FLVIRIAGAGWGSRVKTLSLPVHFGQQGPPAAEALGRRPFGCRKRLEIGPAWILGDEERIVATSQKPGKETRAYMVASRHLVGRRVQANPRRQGTSAGPEVLHRRTEGGEIGRFVLRIAVWLSVPIAGQHVMHRNRVGVVRMGHGADDRQVVRLPS